MFHPVDNNVQYLAVWCREVVEAWGINENQGAPRFRVLQFKWPDSEVAASRTVVDRSDILSSSNIDELRINLRK